jgi:hypothetical protein
MKKIYLLFMCCIGTLTAQQTTFFRTYSMGLFDVGEVVIALNDTSYVVAGTTNVTGMNGTDMLLFKTNGVGDVTWWKNMGGPGIQSGKAAVMAADSSGYLITGYKNNFDSTGYDIWLVKTDVNGNALWNKTYGGNNWEVATAMGKLADSTYIIAGETYSYGNGQRDVYVIHINGNGDTLWTRTFGGAADDVAKCLHIDRHNNILIIGDTKSFGAGNSDVYLIYMDANGDTLWTRTHGTAEDDFGYSADSYLDAGNQLSFGIGYTSYYAPDLAQNSYILLVDSATGANITVQEQLEANPGILDRIEVKYDRPGIFCYIAELKDAYDHISILYGSRTYYGLVYNAGFVSYAGGGNESTKHNDLAHTLDKGYIVTGYSENWGPGPTSCFLLKTDTSLIAPNDPQIGIENIEVQPVNIFPNPVVGTYYFVNAGSEILSVKLYNMNGQLICDYSIQPHSKSLMLTAPETATGLYNIEIKTKETRVNKKILF